MTFDRLPIGLKRIPGYSSHAASEDGGIWNTEGKKPRRLKTSLRKSDGYYRVWIRGDTGKYKTMTVHSLVLITFVGPRPEGLLGCHDDDNKANNQLSNLRWDTHGANISDAIKHGRHDGNSFFRRGIKLSLKKAREIRSETASGVSRRELAERFCVDPQAIYHVLRNHTWKDAENGNWAIEGRPA